MTGTNRFEPTHIEVSDPIRMPAPANMLNLSAREQKQITDKIADLQGPPPANPDDAIAYAIIPQGQRGALGIDADKVFIGPILDNPPEFGGKKFSATHVYDTQTHTMTKVGMQLEMSLGFADKALDGEKERFIERAANIEKVSRRGAGDITTEVDRRNGIYNLTITYPSIDEVSKHESKLGQRVNMSSEDKAYAEINREVIMPPLGDERLIEQFKKSHIIEEKEIARAHKENGTTSTPEDIKTRAEIYEQGLKYIQGIVSKEHPETLTLASGEMDGFSLDKGWVDTIKLTVKDAHDKDKSTTVNIARKDIADYMEANQDPFTNAREIVLDYSNQVAIALDKGKDIPTFKDFTAAKLPEKDRGMQDQPAKEEEKKETSQNSQNGDSIKNAIAALKNGDRSDKHHNHDVIDTIVPQVPGGGGARSRV